MQQIYQGIQHLKDAVSDCKKILLVCDSSFPFLNIKNEIEALPKPYVIFDQFTPNPLYEDVCKGVELFNSEGCDTILAVGGGSSIDVAKCIKLYCKMSTEQLFLDQEYEETGIKLIAIPTTAGTGSESTRYAVIYYDGKKQSVTHESIIPNIAILEPKVLKTLPIYQKKCTMLDALCQGIESWWSVNSTENSKMLSKQAVEIIMKWWHEYIFDNTDNAAEHIMKGANLAGQAICITQTTAPHAFSYKITSLYGIPHGHAVAICLPVIWQYMINHLDICIDHRGKHYLQGIFEDIALAMGCGSTELAIKQFRQMMTSMKLAETVSPCKVDDFVLLTNSVNPVRLKNNPVKLDSTAINTLYRTITKKEE